MIITCPACKTRYNLSGGQLGPSGKKVRCVKCGHEWYQTPDISQDEMKPPLPPENKMLSDAEEGTALLQKIPSHKQLKAIGAIGVGLLLLVVLTLLIFQQFSKPSGQSVQGFVEIADHDDHVPIETPTGLVMSAIEREVIEDGPLVILLFKGKVTNNNSVETTVPTIHVQLLDKKGIELDFWPAEIEKKTLEPGEVTDWTVRFLNPPLDRIYEYKAFFKESQN